ncbi:MAG: single-stranded-DNA-specific exonuclease RecJ [Candidatus Bipolaricaulota bacterium]
MRSLLRERRAWRIAVSPDLSLVSAIEVSLGCARPIAVLLAQRGGASWSALLDAASQHLHPPFDLPDMERAVARLVEAAKKGERVFIHGDFDVDGLTGAAVLYRGLRPLLPPNSVKVEVGDRSAGHGLSRSFVLRAIDEGFSLVVTTDCGVASHEEIAELRAAGIDVVVTDHHLPVGDLPPAVAVVDPHRSDNRYPNPHLAGVGVAYKTMCALYERIGRPAPSALLDLVALGTIADLVPLCADEDNENQLLVREAFRLLAAGQGSSLGLRTLMAKLSINPNKLTTTDFGYLVAPKLNAANRAGDPKVAFLLLITEIADQAEYLAEILLDYNRDREIAQNDLIAQAEDLIRSDALDPQEDGLLFLVGKYWNEGILGLVASNLAERYRVPTIILSRGDRVSRGSCRSVGDFDISACLESVSRLLLQYGGHRMAAGFSASNDVLGELEERLLEYVHAHRSSIAAFNPEVIDTEVQLGEVDLRFYTNLSSLAPYGPGNPPPRFLLRDCSFDGLSLVGNRRQHLKGRVTQNGFALPFIAFRLGKHLDTFERAPRSDLICQIGFDDWRNDVQVQGVDLVAPAELS